MTDTGGDDMKKIIRKMIDRSDHVTYVELQNAVGDSSKGQFSLELAEKNIVYWTGMSEEFVDAIQELLDEGAIHQAGSSPLVYAIDGGMLSIPLAKKPPKNGYKKSRWLPTCFRSGPSPC